MPITTTLAACNTNPALNGPAGSDLPSDLDDGLRYALSFIAQLRDGAAIPTGVMLPWLTTAAAPTGWIKANGALVSRATYANLFAFATAAGLVSEAAWTGGSFGAFSVGDGSTTFRLIDARAMFLRGLDESRGLDTGRAYGVWQDHTVLSHTHGVNDPSHAHSVYDPGHVHGASTDVQGAHAHTYQAGVNSVFTAGGAAPVAQQTNAATSVDGAHGHNVTINLNGSNIAIYAAGTGVSIQAAGSAEARVRNLAYPFIIKF